MKQSPVKRLLVVEDDELFCRVVEHTLTHEGFTVKALLNGESIPKAMSRNRFDLVILDLVLPDKPGLYWIKWFKRYYPGLPIIIMSARIKPKHRLEALKAGALDYLTKPFDVEELLIKIRLFLEYRVEDARETSLIEMREFVLDTAKQVLTKHGELIELTKQECDILQLFFMHPGVPLSREDLMSQAMGLDYPALSRSIDTHINRLRKKVEEVPSKPVYIHTVRNRGYRFQLPG